MSWTPSREVVVGQKPDLLFSYGLVSTSAEDLQAVGIEQLIVGGQCDDQASDGPQLDREVRFEIVYQDIELCGQIFGTQDVARKAVDGLRQRLARVKERSQGNPARTAAVLSVSGASPTFSCRRWGSPMSSRM
jgi:iron complex transport system substrate-binding protein